MRKRITRLTSVALCVLLLLSFLYAQDVSQRQIVIVFNGPINQVTVGRLIIAVQEKVARGAQSITILMNSNGGEVDAALAAYGYLRGLKVSLTTHNFGIVDSSAVIVYCAGTKRLASPDSRFVLHGISIVFKEVPIDENQVSEHLRIMQLQTTAMATIFAKTTGKAPQVVKDAISAKTALTSQQAKDWSFVTEISASLYESGADVSFVPIP